MTHVKKSVRRIRYRAIRGLVLFASVWTQSASAQDPSPPRAEATPEPSARPEQTTPPEPKSPEPGPSLPSTPAWHPGLEVFAQYAYRRTESSGGDSAWFHAFDAPRVHAWLEAEYDHVRGKVLLEGVRSTADGALIGVSGDSVLLRAREAFGAYAPFSFLELRGGIVPTPTIAVLEQSWRMRAIAPSGIETAGLSSPADLGGQVRAIFPKDHGFASVAAYNGEGYARRELNRGKNAEVAALVFPLASMQSLRPLGVFASYVAGSAGVGLSRADRATGALVWQGDRVRGGVSGTYAWGVDGIGAERGAALDVFVRVEPIDRFLLGARLTHWMRARNAEDVVTTIWGALGYRIAAPLEGFLSVTRALPSALAEGSLPGSKFWEARVTTRIAFP